MLTALRKSVSGLLPVRWKRRIWRLTDREYRRQMAEVDRARAARKAAMAEIWRASHGCILTGPFAGMQYLPSWKNTYFTQKLLGTYESELDGVLGEMTGRAYRQVIDIGAGEGYYACGLPYLWPDARVRAYEAYPLWHPALAKLAALNGLGDRIVIGGSCDAEKLAKDLETELPTLVVCDIDGGEWEVLDPVSTPRLLEVDILVEVHDALRPGVTDLLKSRFAGSHQVTFIAQRPRTLEDLPAAVHLPPALALHALDEGRGDGNDWLWLRRLDGGR